MAANFRTHLYYFIENYINDHHSSPSFAEMISAMGIGVHSKSLITRSLQQLAKEGKVELAKAGRRLSISLSSKNLKVLGRISAGIPIEAIEQPHPLDLNHLFQGAGRFALQVKGMSMMDEGIFDGDIIICQKVEVAKEGDIVVALIDQHTATLKRISYKIKGMVTLLPANPEFKPRVYCQGRIAVQGVYLGLIRMHR